MRREYQREADAWALAHTDCNSEKERSLQEKANRLLWALKSGNHDETLYETKVVAAALGIPIKRVRLAAKARKVRSWYRGNGIRKRWFLSADIAASKVVFEIASEALITNRKFEPGELLTKKQAALMSGLTTRGIEYRVSIGKLRPIKIGRRVFFPTKKIAPKQKKIWRAPVTTGALNAS